MVKVEAPEIVESWGVGTKPIYQLDDLYVKSIRVPSDPIQVDSDTTMRYAVTIYARSDNTDVIYVGNQNSQVYPLDPGTSVTIMKCSLSKIYLKAAVSGDWASIAAGGI